MRKRLYFISCVAFLLGIAIGLFLREPPKVHAGGMIYVDEVKFTPSGLGGQRGTAFPLGSQVTGFSCVELNGTPHCFVESVQ